MAEKEENKKEENEKSRYKCNPKLQVYDEFGYESSDEYMNELKKHKELMKKKIIKF